MGGRVLETRPFCCGRACKPSGRGPYTLGAPALLRCAKIAAGPGSLSHRRCETHDAHAIVFFAPALLYSSGQCVGQGRSGQDEGRPHHAQTLPGTRIATRTQHRYSKPATASTPTPAKKVIGQGSHDNQNDDYHYQGSHC